MFDRHNTGKLLSFPAPAPASEPSTEEWSRRILETRDNLVSALEFLRIAYNESLAGRSVRSADEIMAKVDIIMKHDETMPAYTVVGSIKIHGPESPETRRRVLLSFPLGASKASQRPV
jgi:hypothetical protein